MAINKIKVGWSTGGRIVFGTNSYHYGKDWSEGSGDSYTMNVLMTGGDISVARTPISETMASIGEIDNNASISEVLLSDGIIAISGNLSFSCTKLELGNLLNWILNKRKRSFSVYIGTEDFNYYKITSCTWNSFTLNCAEANILNCSISFSSNRGPENFAPSEPFFTPNFKDSELIPYWQTGLINTNDNVILNTVSWDLSVTQNVTPAYMNTKDFDFPAYFRIANWDINLTGNMIIKKKSNTEIENIVFDQVQLGVDQSSNPIFLIVNEGIQISASASFGGIDAMGNYTYALKLVGIPNSYLDNAYKNNTFTLNVS